MGSINNYHEHVCMPHQKFNEVSVIQRTACEMLPTHQELGLKLDLDGQPCCVTIESVTSTLNLSQNHHRLSSHDIGTFSFSRLGFVKC
jgi:hypothetical protein